MKIGVSLFPGQYPIDAAVMAQKAEALGFDSLWVGEHPIMPVQSTSPAPGSCGSSIPDFYSRLVDPFVALARAFAVTTTLKLGTGVTLLPERNPLLLAKQVATLDSFSRGRCDSGNSRQRCRSPCDRASVMPSCNWIPATLPGF
jgi:alkanesulfonate monooxygenase SsuD/methylene tetrahydromethanopterin reductase-like flavin-dependent oxidoreductase (luciferase family)